MVSKLLFLRKLFSRHWNSIYFWSADVFSSYIREFQMVLILGNSCNLNKKDFNSFMSFLRRKPPFSCLQARTISYYVSTEKGHYSTFTLSLIFKWYTANLRPTLFRWSKLNYYAVSALFWRYFLLLW